MTWSPVALTACTRLSTFVIAGSSICVNTAPEVARMAHVVTEAPGGGGVVREVVELILRASDRWDRAIEPFVR